MNASIGKVGELMAVIEKIKNDLRYTNDINHNQFISNINFSFVDMIKKINYYIKEMSKKKGMGLSIYYERMLCDILDGIDTQSLKKTRLNDDETCQLIMAYWQRKKTLFPKKAEEVKELKNND